MLPCGNNDTLRAGWQEAIAGDNSTNGHLEKQKQRTSAIKAHTALHCFAFGGAYLDERVLCQETVQSSAHGLTRRCAWRGQS
jgi:hypothetical protein